MKQDLFNFKGIYDAIRFYPWYAVLLEMLLIGTFIYLIVRFLRGTRGARMLKGIGFVLVVLYLIITLVANALHLDRIDFLYGKFLFLASFATIVVFQPELRRALMRLGETRLFKSWSEQIFDDVQELVEAAVYCARRKIGALIAVEREVGLGGIAESGTHLDAELSAALLNTIFWPNSPLHDLGVIVSNGRITYAGVQFPLAESGDIERELGSRHRAAVGLSQESDALVIVVSEETGDISIADRGHLIRKLTPDQLRQELSQRLGRTPSPPSTPSPTDAREQKAAA